MTQRHPCQNQHLMFVTTNIRDRAPIFSDAAHAREAIDCLYRTQEMHPFLLFGFVIIPDHCHFLMQVPERGSISKLMHIYKRSVAFALARGPIWQSRFYLKIPRNASRVLRYIHNNPVVAGLCESSHQYPWSSASGKWDVTSLELEIA